MISEARKKQILKSVVESKEFANSQISRDLLQYLVDCSLKNEMVKEISVAIEFPPLFFINYSGKGMKPKIVSG